MAEKKINPFVKLGLELGPVILFFVMFGRLKDQTFTIAGGSYSGFIVTTAAVVALLIVTTGILWALTGGEMCVCDLAGLLEASESAVSHQLRLLRQLALVQNRRQGQVLYYRLADDHIQTLVRTALEHIRE